MVDTIKIADLAASQANPFDLDRIVPFYFPLVKRANIHQYQRFNFRFPSDDVPSKKL